MAIDCIDYKLELGSDYHIFAHAFSDFEANVVPVCIVVT